MRRPPRAARAGEALRRAGNLHSAPAAARCRLHQHRVADPVGDPGGLRIVLDRGIAAGHRRDADLDHGRLGGDLVAHRRDMFGTGPDEGEAVIRDHLGEGGVFREEAEARMDRVRAGHARGRDQRGHAQIAVARRGRADAHALVRKAHMHGVGVDGGMDRDGADAEVPAGADDAKRDFAAVGDQDLFEHRLSRGS